MSSDKREDDIIESEEEESQEEKRINEEYKIWKKNSAFLYDMVITHALEWPSLTVEWLPGKQLYSKINTNDSEKGYDYSSQSVLLGTHTSQSEQNYLMVAKVVLPTEDTEVDIKKYDSKSNDHGGFGAPKAKIEIVQRINHDGEVHRARHMPQNANFVATKTPSANVFLFDLSKHGTSPSQDGVCTPLVKLKGHKKEGYGLNWSPKTAGRLASGSDDGIVCVWDIEAKPTSSELNPIFTWTDHGDIVEDVAWHRIHEGILASVSDDRHARIFDLRNNKVSSNWQAHKGEVNSIDFSPFSETLFLTASSDSTVKIWDMRNLKSELHTFVGHGAEVFTVQWSPFNETIFASSGADRHCNLWDLTRIGMEQSSEDAEDGPPELLFVHGGHTAKISEFSWNPNRGEDWVIASVAEDNIVQMWQVAGNIYDDESKVDESLF